MSIDVVVERLKGLVAFKKKYKEHNFETDLISAK